MKGKIEILREAGRKHRDPLTGQPGSHPVGTGLGSAGGATAGAAAGAAVGGPLGAVVGGVVGAVAGGAAGHALGEALDPTVETAYGRTACTTRPCDRADRTFDDLESAPPQGWERELSAEAGRRFEAVKNDLERTWPLSRDGSIVDGKDAHEAARHSWNRVRDRAAESTTLPKRLLGDEP